MSFIRIQKNKCQDNVGETAPAQVKDNTAHSLTAKDAEAPAILGSFAHTDRKKKKWRYTLGYSGRTALRRNQCGVSVENQNCEASRDSHC
jgi:hypothetical protein